MPSEIERKYVVDPALWKPEGAGTLYSQGYLSSNPERVVRVRIEGAAAKLTIKGKNVGITRPEFEYDIPVEDARLLLRDLCEQPLIEKRRHVELHGGRTWEIDVFLGDNEGLVVAEIELASEDEPVDPPAWAIEDVSHDPRYYNANLVSHPYKRWRP